MSTRAKGQRYENEVADMLRLQGWQVQKVGGSHKFNSQVDFFEGMFDGIAYNSSGWLLYQVKTNSTAGWPVKAKAWLNTQNLPPNTQIKLFVRYTKHSDKLKWGVIREIMI